MIKNINLMQNEKDIAWDQYSEEYIIQALANLGQRVGIRGDGISYKSFTFNDILKSNESYSASEYIGTISYDENSAGTSKYKANFGIARKLDLDDIINLETSININDVLYFPSDLSLTMPVNGIEKYSKNSICTNDGSELTFILVGKHIGYDDGADDNSIILYYKFDILSNKLKYAAKLDSYLHDESGDYYILTTIKNSTYTQKKLSNKYDLSFQLFNAASITDETTRNSFKSIFRFDNYGDVTGVPFNILNEDFIDIENLESYNDSTTNYDSNSPIALVLHHAKNKALYPAHTVKLKYDTDGNQLLVQNVDEYESIINLYQNEYQLNLDEEIYFLNEDINRLYYTIFEFYNEKFYLEDRTAFVRRILSKIYEKASERQYSDTGRLYIPLDYEFHYICNSNNEMQVYYSNDIYVTYIDMGKTDLEEFWKTNTNLIYDYNKVDKVKAYNFEINYNKYKETLINSVVIKDIYTMPYINASNNWSINDMDTKVQAIGKDAGNPNIIIIFNNDKEEVSDSYEILNAISNKKYIIGADYKIKWFNVNNALFENVYDYDIKCCAYMPTITTTNFDYFKNSVILSISDLKCLDKDDYKYNYKGSYILTLWHLVENEKGGYEFKCITQSNEDYALALGSTVNLLNETDDASIANLNAQDLILLKSVINTVAQERLAINSNNWLIIKNKQAEEYYEGSDPIYRNDLNAAIQYNDTLSIKANHIIHSQNSKYVKDISNVSITNSLYPKYSTSTKKVKKTEYITTLQSIPNAVTKTRETIVRVNGSQVTNIESLIEELSNGTQEFTNPVNITVDEAVRTSSQYNEYVFNSNIPTADFKEVFNRNVNVLNRVNIISLDHNGKAYNSYIGTSFDEANKSTLHIGTSNTNINIGSETLMNEVDKSKFNKHDTISIDFDTIKLNSGSIITKMNPLTQYVNNAITYTMSSVQLIGACMPDKVPSSTATRASWNNSSNGIFAKRTVNNNPKYYISINNIMKSIFSIDLKDYSVQVESGDYTSISFKRTTMNDTVYLVNIDGNTVYELENNILYCPSLMNVLYYTSVTYENGQKINKIRIIISFNK